MPLGEVLAAVRAAHAAFQEEALRRCGLFFIHDDALITPALTPPARLVNAVGAAGVPVEGAGFHPAWTAQLLG